MFGINYFKADSATYVIKTVNGRVKKQGKGLSFFYNAATTSVATIPVSAQEAPFIFNLQTADFQSIKVQGQITYRLVDPEKTAEMLNFNLKRDGINYVSEDPLKLGDRVVRAVQVLVQREVQLQKLKPALALGQTLVRTIKSELQSESTLGALGVEILEAVISAISPTPETARALEAEAREALLKEADDAIYTRRKSSVEQERTIKDAELQTQLAVQQKEQEIEESRIANERALLRGELETNRERLAGEIESEEKRKQLVEIAVENRKVESDAEAYAINVRMKAYSALPVENLKAMAMASMAPEQLMALAFESLAQNADKIKELTITPDLFSEIRKVAR